MIFGFPYRLWRTKVPLLAQDLPISVLTFSRPAQREFLGSLDSCLFKHQADTSERLRFVEHQPDSLGPRGGRGPAAILAGEQSRFNRVALVLRGHFHGCCIV